MAQATAGVVIMSAVAGIVGAGVELTLGLVLGGILVCLTAVLASPERQPPRYFAAMVEPQVSERSGLVVGAGDTLAASHQPGSLGPHEGEILRFLERMRGITGEDWNRVLCPMRNLQGGWFEDRRARLAYAWAQRAMVATRRHAECAAALAELVRAEFRQGTGTMDMNAPSHAHAATLAIMVRDALPPPVFRWLYAPFEPVIPFDEIRARAAP